MRVSQVKEIHLVSEPVKNTMSASIHMYFLRRILMHKAVTRIENKNLEHICLQYYKFCNKIRTIHIFLFVIFYFSSLCCINWSLNAGT